MRRRDATERLADLASQGERAGDFQRITPAVQLATEWSLTTGLPMPLEWLRRLTADAHARGG